MSVSSNQIRDDKPYRYVPRTLIFVTCGEHVLLLKGAPHKKLWAGLYNGVGGHVEKGEDIFTSAKRELLEETGISPAALWLCGLISIDAEEDSGIFLFVFRGIVDSMEEPLSTKEGTAEWVRLSEVKEKPLVEDLPVILPRVLAATNDRPPFSAHYSYSENGLLIRFNQE